MSDLDDEPAAHETTREERHEELREPEPASRRGGRAAEALDPAWQERQRRIERYRARLEEGKGIFSEEQTPERPLKELFAELGWRSRRGLALEEEGTRRRRRRRRASGAA